jgi:hypothetical protein
MWRQHEAIDGTYSFEDLLVAHELLDVKEVNEALYREWEARK